MVPWADTDVNPTAIREQTKQGVLLEGGESLGTRVSRGQALCPGAQGKDRGLGGGWAPVMGIWGTEIILRPSRVPASGESGKW